MKFKHLFYDNTVDFRKISKRRLIVSIVLGLLSAISIYFTFSVLRESFRLIFSGIENAPLIVDESNRNFYNLFFAFISFIFGNSIFISLLFSSPTSVFSKRNMKRSRIFNDQVALNSYFMQWFGKMAIVFASFSLGMLDFQFLPDYYWVFILLVLVLYFETWKTLMLVLGKNKFKMLIIHFSLISVLSLGLSKINVLDYKAIDAVFLVESPICNYPETYFTSSNYNLYRSPLLKVGLKLDENDNLIIRTENQGDIKLNKLPKLILQEKAALPEELIYRILVHISADRDIKLKHIKAFEAELYLNNVYKVWYQTNNPNILTKRFAIYGFQDRIYEFALEFKAENQFPLPPLLPMPEIDYSRFNEVIKVEVDDVIKFNNVITKDKELIKAFESKIDSTTLFEYSLNPETSYQNYITVLSAHKKARHNLMQNKVTFDISLDNYRYRYDDEKMDQIRTLYKEFPILIKEVKKQYPKKP